MHIIGAMTADPAEMRAFRKRHNWRQDRMARYLGVDSSSVSRMERAQRLKGPTAKLLQDLLNAEAADLSDPRPGLSRVDELAPLPPPPPVEAVEANPDLEAVE